MSEQYTPTTDEVRLKFAYEERPANGTSPALIKAFDRWLDHVRAVARREGQAEAWEAGAQAQAAAYGMDKDTGPNPYRQDADHDRP